MTPRNSAVPSRTAPRRSATRIEAWFSGRMKLAGAALTSFMTKCQKDAQASCDTAAQEKKLNGAAKTSFTKKCVKDATGA